MKPLVMAAAMLLLIVAPTGTLAAQQPDQRGARDSAAGMMMQGMQQHMQMMDSMNARLDTLVRRMNQATGNAKVTAMAQVINEMVAERKAMRTQMRKMMEMHGRKMRGQPGAPMRDSMSGPPGASSHEEHHPAQ